MAYKLDIVHKKYYSNSRVELVSVSLVEVDGTAAYDYDRGTSWKAEGGDWSSTYRMAAYFTTIASRKLYTALSSDGQKTLATQLAAEWQTYGDYYTMKVELTGEPGNLHYYMGKSGIVGSGTCSGDLSIYAVSDVVYDNDILNHPKILSKALEEYSLSKILDLSSGLSGEFISEVIGSGDGELMLAGLISIDHI